MNAPECPRCHADLDWLVDGTSVHALTGDAECEPTEAEDAALELHDAVMDTLAGMAADAGRVTVECIDGTTWAVMVDGLDIVYVEPTGPHAAQVRLPHCTPGVDGRVHRVGTERHTFDVDRSDAVEPA